MAGWELPLWGGLLEWSLPGVVILGPLLGI